MEEVSYLTQEGAEKLRKELENLKGSAREQLSKRLRNAIQQGDLSENADYISAKEEQGFLEGRILDLEKALHNVEIIDQTKTHTIVEVGAKVTIQEGNDSPDTYDIVGPKEADPSKGRISFASPIGAQLQGHKVGDVVKVKTPGGEINIKIVKIE
jgi:transcription elongation factor GreA